MSALGQSKHHVRFTPKKQTSNGDLRPVNLIAHFPDMLRDIFVGALA